MKKKIAATAVGQVRTCDRTSGLLDAIGNTPLVEVKRIRSPQGARIMVKLEGHNPGGSVKDRPAYWMIKKAEEDGLLTQEKTILEPTSGNTGIGLAMVAVCKGYRLKLTLPECVSVERRQILLAYGAELVLTPAGERTDGAIRAAQKLYEENPEHYFMPNQFANPANWLSHYETTGPEIIAQTGGKLSAFVAGMGTTGTLMGVARRLKEHDSSIRIVGVEPVMGHTIQGLKNMQEAIVPKIYEKEWLDQIIVVDDHSAFSMANRMAVEEGIFAGMSSGAALYAALSVAADLAPDDVVVALLPDRGDRYLSTSLFRSTCAQCAP